MIIKHACASKFQDERYGSGNRVMNKCGKLPNTYRCTVCGKEYSKGVVGKDKK